MLVLFSCGGDEEILAVKNSKCLLTSEKRGSADITYEYNELNQLVRVVGNWESLNKLTETFLEWDDQGRVVKIYDQENQTELSYFADSIIVNADLEFSSSGFFQGKNVYILDELGRFVELIYNGNTWMQVTYFEDDNIKEIFVRTSNGLVQLVEYFEYDTLRSNYSNIPFTFYLEEGNVLGGYSPFNFINNPLRSKVVFREEEDLFSYEYNALGYPVRAGRNTSSFVDTYGYLCN